MHGPGRPTGGQMPPAADGKDPGGWGRPQHLLNMCSTVTLGNIPCWWLQAGHPRASLCGGSSGARPLHPPSLRKPGGSEPQGRPLGASLLYPALQCCRRIWALGPETAHRASLRGIGRNARASGGLNVQVVWMACGKRPWQARWTGHGLQAVCLAGHSPPLGTATRGAPTI